MKQGVKQGLKVVGGLFVVGAAVAGIYVKTRISAFDESIARVHDIPIPNVAHSTDPAVLARGKHLADSVAGCAVKECHGVDLGGGKPIVIGPLGTFTGPNLTLTTIAYSDGELARLIHHGVKKDGRSLRFMPAHEVSWLPDDDTVAVISFIRSMPRVDKANGEVRVGWLGKVLDRRDEFVMDVARRIETIKPEPVPAPQPNASYGRFLARLCSGCHGERMSGGPIPGAPPSLPVPLNITPHETGLKGWTQADFDRLLQQGIRKNGSAVNPFMPFESFGKMDDVERTALFSYLQSLPPTPFGKR